MRLRIPQEHEPRERSIERLKPFSSVSRELRIAPRHIHNQLAQGGGFVDESFR